MSQQAGWYDDPENPDDLRYWDGVQWTSHTSPRQKPNLEQAGRVIRAEDGWDTAGQQGQRQQGWGQQGSAPQDGQGSPYGAQPPFQGQHPWQGQGQEQWQPMPGAAQLQTVPTTPDGQPLSGWWRRVGARLLDAVILGVVGSFVANLVVPGVWSDYLTWAMEATDPANAGSAGSLELPPDLLSRFSQWSLVIGVLGLVYEIVLVRLLGGTLGKLATGVRVRLRDQQGNVGWGTSILRALGYQLAGLFLPLFVLNVLWPLWDGKRQALHDKPARTNVVRKG